MFIFLCTFKTLRYVICGASFLVFLSSCGLFVDRSEEYKQTGSIKVIEIPPEYKSAELEPLYAIPPVREGKTDFLVQENKKKDAPRPIPMNEEAEFAKVKIQKVKGRRWILLEAPTAQVWPLTQNFLTQSGISVAKAQPSIGIIETKWLVFEADKDSKSRFQVSIEKGVRDETTEVHVINQKLALQNVVSDIPWPAKSSDLEREAALLDDMANHLAGEVNNRAASLLGQSVGGEDKVTLGYDNEEPVMRLQLDFERTWATVGQALDKEGFIVWDEDMDSRLFYVRFQLPSKKRGFWKRTLGIDKPLPLTSAYNLQELLASMSARPEANLFQSIKGFNTASAADALGYLVKITRVNTVETVHIRNARGEYLPVEQAKQMLAIIRRNLI